MDDTTFLAALLDKRIILKSGMADLFGHGPLFEEVLRRFNAYLSREVAADGAEELHFPPVLPRRDFQRGSVDQSQPQAAAFTMAIAGTISSFQGMNTNFDELRRRLEADEEWASMQDPTDTVLTTAACLPVYPALTGTLPADGKLVDVTAYCYRREPSNDVLRMLSFRMREHIRLGEGAAVDAWRRSWFDRGLKVLTDIGLPARLAQADDSFYSGRGEPKFELVVPVSSVNKPTAVMSVNSHQSHFGRTFGINTSKGEPAQSGCVAFGLERLVLALFRTHGLEPSSWPADVRAKLEA